VAAELAARLEHLELSQRLETAALPAWEGGAELDDLRGEPVRELLSDVAEGGAFQGARLVAHFTEPIQLDVQVTDLTEGVLEFPDHPVRTPDALPVAEEGEHGAKTAAGDPRIVDLLGAEARPELGQLPLDVGQPRGQERAGRLGHGRRRFEVADGGGLGHSRASPYRGSTVDWAERAGVVGGWALAVVTGAGAWLRRARFFHPEGVVYVAKVTNAGTDARTRAVGERLAGAALVRFSSAVWRKHEWKDVLGMAVRFRRTAVPSAEAEPTDQDLLCATIRSPWTTLLAAIPTRVHDFLKNDFHGVSPFQVDGEGRVKLRFRAPEHERRPGGSRQERLDLAVKAGRAVLTLEMRPLLALGRWQPVATVALEHPVRIDQATLRFSPFRNGRGVVPRGFVHALRVATYAASQAMRPESSNEAARDAGRRLPVGGGEARPRGRTARRPARST